MFLYFFSRKGRADQYLRRRIIGKQFILLFFVNFASLYFKLIMEKFLSCDWGTSAFRLRLIEAESLTIIEEENTVQGIAPTFQLWKESGKKEEERQKFYLDIISNHIKSITKRSGIDVDNSPLIISGMASSTIGMIDLSYKNLPFFTNGEDVETFIIEALQDFPHKVIVISGVRTEDDVMRGEETKLIGCAADINSNEDHIYIFPGTHPKHIEVKNGKAIAFNTYMTGEFFDLLSKKSILAVSVKKNDGFELKNNFESFTKGVNESSVSNLLHSCFLVRTNEVFKKLSAEENYFYLSGLLIGTELKDLIDYSGTITIVGNAALTAQYTAALRVLNLPKKDALVKSIDADEALIKGQFQIYKKVGK